MYLEHVPGLLELSSSLRFSCSCVQRWRFILFGEWARIFSMLAQYGSHGVYDKGMKSADAKAPIVMGGALQLGSTSFLYEFIQQQFPRNEGAESTCWTQEPRLTIFYT